MIKQWIQDIRNSSNPDNLGMFLVHCGVVRSTSKKGEPVKGMNLTYDTHKLDRVTEEIRKKDGIVDVKVWINEGLLSVGDTIMYALVAGKFRTDVFPALQELVTKIKTEVVNEKEFLNE